MNYPLYFFDEMVGQVITSDYYWIDPPEIINEKILTDTIKKEGSRVLRVLRSEFYSSTENQQRSIDFEKILKRLLMLKEELEESIKSSQHKYISLGPSRSHEFPKLENFYSLFDHVCAFIGVILFEFDFNYEWVDKEIATGRDFYFFSEEDLLEDFQEIAKLDKRGLPVPEDITSLYSLDKRFFELFKPMRPQIYESHRISQIEKVVHLFRDDSHMEFKEYVKIFINDYFVFNKDAGLSFFYRLALSFLKEKLEKIKETDKKVDFILDFMLHTNLASELTLKFINQKLQLLEMTDNEEIVVTGLKRYKDKLNVIRETPKYQKFNVSRIKSVERSTIDDAFLILNEFLERNGIMPEKNQNIDPNLPNRVKIAVNLNKKEIGILLELLFDAGIFSKPKTKIVKSIAEAITVKETGDISYEVLYNQLSGWDKDDDETDNVRKLLQNMVKVTINKTREGKKNDKKRKV